MSQKNLSSMVQALAEICLAKSLVIATAESCTGGGVAYSLTALPGSSHWFDRGFVTYSNAAKVDMLGVDNTDIERYGAVSEIVARQMAEGAILHSAANLSLAITGIAGPTGGTLEKPVGTCWFSWASHHFETHASHCILEGNREEVRSKAILFAIGGLVQLIKEGLHP